MKITISIPNFLKKNTGSDNLKLEFNQDNIRLIDVLRELEERVPQAKGRVLKEGSLNNFITYFVNNESSRLLQHGATSLKDGDHLTLISAIAGG